MALETQEIVGGIRAGKLGGSIMMGGLWGEGSGEAGQAQWKLGWAEKKLWGRLWRGWNRGLGEAGLDLGANVV